MRIRAADLIARADLRRPHAREIRGEHRGAQADPLQPGGHGELLHFAVAVPAYPGWLPAVIVIGVDRRQGDQASHPGGAGQIDCGGQLRAEGAGVEEDRRGAGHPVGGGSDRFDAEREHGVRITGDRAYAGTGTDEFGDERAADITGCPRDENCVHAIKDGAAVRKVTAAPIQDHE